MRSARASAHEGQSREAIVEVSLARERLERARGKVDLAMAAFPDVGGEEVMGTLGLSALLIGAVTARERLEALEAVLADQTSGGMMTTTSKGTHVLG